MNNIASLKPYQALDDWCRDLALLTQVKACIEAQKQAAEGVRASVFQPSSQAVMAVSEGALQSILESGRDVHGISSDGGISNVIVFNGGHIKGAVSDRGLLAMRQVVDETVSKKIVECFTSSRDLAVACSGHLWYPPGAYMGWHTNSRAPGWRLYISYAEEPGKSFFRYRDPDTHQIITSWDEQWNARLFEVRADKPLWHAVYSETNRFSLGYVVYPRSLQAWVRRKISRLLKIG
jgi:hypothetical protein